MKSKKKIIFWICLLAFVGAISFMVTWWYLQKQNSDIYEQLQEMNPVVTVTSTPSPTQEPPKQEEPEVTVTAEPTVELPKVEIPIDFDSLREVNEEIYAWIRIPDTRVDYPILQRRSDDTYYLNHTVDGKKGYPGSIYTESLNAKDFLDRNTVIYGHNMKNGSMFGELSLYMDDDYMKEHQLIFIYTPEHIFTYQIFAAVTYDNRHILHSFDFTEEEGMKAFLDSIASVRNMSGYWDESVEISVSDRILTLSTCVGNKSKRFIVEAVLIDEQ